MAVLPQEVVTHIGRAYALGRACLREKGIAEEESVDVALAAEAHRWFWKPPQVKTLVLGVFRCLSTQEELSHRCKTRFALTNGTTPPDSFVRSPYCLAFGEPALCPSLNPEDNTAPLLCWDVFGDLAGTGDCPVDEDLVKRLEWKVKTLRAMAQRGIWCLDATLHPTHDDDCLLETAWEKVSRIVWEDEQRPHLICVGKTLHSKLASVGVPLDDWLYHPNRISQETQKVHQETVLRRIVTTNPASQH